MRLFIAIQFEENILAALTGFQKELRKIGAVGNYTRDENLHLMLAFIGEYGNPDDVLDAMAGGRKKFVRYEEGARLYSMGLHSFEALVKEAGTACDVLFRIIIVPIDILGANKLLWKSEKEV